VSMSWDECILVCKNVSSAEVIDFIRIQLDLGVWVEKQGVIFKK